MGTSEIVFGVVSFFGAFLGMMAKDFFSSASKETGKVVIELANAEELAMLKAKGTNAATKEDIREITRGQEEIKLEFQLKLDQQKTELNKLSKEFELYVIKKHEYYPKLYKSFLECVSKVTYLRGPRDGVDFKKFEIEEITRYMEDESFTALDKKYVLSNWNDNQKHLAIHHVEKMLIKKEYIEAKESFRAANNFYTLHLLYFSDEVSLIVPFLLSDIQALLNNYNPDLMMSDTNMVSEDVYTANEEAVDKIDQRLNELFAQLQSELKNEKHE